MDIFEFIGTGVEVGAQLWFRLTLLAKDRGQLRKLWPSCWQMVHFVGLLQLATVWPS